MPPRRTSIQKALNGGISAYAPKSIAFPGAVPRKGLSASQDRVKDAMQPSLGAQLSKRVSSGAISEQQAQRTSQQRALLKRAFGDDWRSQVFGQGGAKGINGPFSTSQVRTKRIQALEQARAKVRGSGGTTAK